jgi:DNA-binding winged helix-turn-helix (wHTH) protein
MKLRSPLSYEFGPYRLEVAECRLLRHGREVTLRPKLFDLLVVLVERHGQMLGKDELLSTVWPDSAVEENNLTVSINELRRALGKEYIETVARRGYRFTAEVRTVPRPAASSSSSSSPLEPPPPGGALPLHSPFYIVRDIDQEFYAALARRDSIVLVQGAR